MITIKKLIQTSELTLSYQLKFTQQPQTIPKGVNRCFPTITTNKNIATTHTYTKIKKKKKKKKKKKSRDIKHNNFGDEVQTF
jgi:hypothetical protein